MANTIEVSKDGIKFSYRRFLSDSSAGYLSLLSLAFLYYVPLFQQQSVQKYYALSFSTEAKTFILLLLFLLAMPLGLAVNALSWFIFGQLLNNVEFFWFENRSCFVKPSMDFNHFETVCTYFNISSQNWLQFQSHIRKILGLFAQNRYERKEYVEGIKIFFRNLLLLSCVFLLWFMVSIWSHFSSHLNEILGIISFAGLCFIMSSLLQFYHNLEIAYEGYVLCMQHALPDKERNKVEEMFSYFTELNAKKAVLVTTTPTPSGTPTP